jgi:hypothetical protein
MGQFSVTVVTPGGMQGNHHPPLAFPEYLERVIGRNSQNPSGETRFTPKAIEILHDAYESLLGGVLGVFRLLQNPPCQPIDSGFEPRDQRLESTPFPCDRQGDQLLVAKCCLGTRSRAILGSFLLSH